MRKHFRPRIDYKQVCRSAINKSLNQDAQQASRDREDTENTTGDIQEQRTKCSGAIMTTEQGAESDVVNPVGVKNSIWHAAHLS